MAVKSTTKSDVKKIKKAVSGKKDAEEKEDSESIGEPQLTDLPGIGPAVAAKLESAGVFDMMSLAVMGPAQLSDAAGVSAAIARKAIQSARNMLQLGFQDGMEYAKKRESVINITSGSKNVDELLGGKGVESRAITEAFGAYGSGKTQFGLTLAVNVQLPIEKGGANGKCVFIDTEGTFRPARIKQIAENLGANSEKVLKNIFVARAFNSDHQILLLEKVSEMVKGGEPIKLMIIDSLTAHFRAEYSGRGQLADRQQKLNKYMHQLMKLAEQHNLAVYVTNQVMSNPAMMFGDPTTAIGGTIVGHACLIGDSLIQLGDGSIKQIKDMKREKIISGNFEKLNFENSDSDLVFVNPAIEEVFNIKTNNQIQCSGLHRFFTVENFSLVEKEAKSLKEGDFVLQARKVNVKGEEQRLPEISVKRVEKISKKSCEQIKNDLEENKETMEEVCNKIGITKRQFRRLLNQNYSTNVQVLHKLREHFSGRLKLQMMFVYTCKHKNLVMPEFMTPALGQICGYFISDGNFEERGLRFRDERFDVLQIYKQLFKQTFNIDGNISKMKNKNCYTLDINSKEVRDLFEQIMLNVFDYIGKSKDEVVKGFIRGFIDAEGYVNKKRAMIIIAQKQRQILRHLQMFLLRFGIRSTIKFGIGRKKMNVLRIIARDVVDYCKIGFSALDKQVQLLRWKKYYENTYSYDLMPLARKEIWQLLRDAGLFPSKVIKSRSPSYRWINRRELEKVFSALMDVEIKDRQVKQKISFIFKLLNSDLRFEKIRGIKVSENKDGKMFYDFSVPKNENYIANGFVVHNSTYRVYLRRGKKGSRVAKLIDSPNLPDNECVFWVTNGGVGDDEA